MVFRKKKGFILRLACGEQTHFSALVSPAEKKAIFSAGEARAEKCVCSPQAILRYVGNGKWPAINWNFEGLRYDVVGSYFSTFSELGG